jgi:hypothetical protein
MRFHEFKNMLIIVLCFFCAEIPHWIGASSGGATVIVNIHVFHDKISVAVKTSDKMTSCISREEPSSTTSHCSRHPASAEGSQSFFSSWKIQETWE